MAELKRKEESGDGPRSKKPKTEASTNGKSRISNDQPPKKWNNAAPSQTTTSREAHAKQKILAQERRAAKPNADQIERTKKIWERLRRKSHVPAEERKALVAELFGIVTGHVKDFVFKHDSVRAIQTSLKYGNLEQRKTVARELKGSFRELAESKYAKNLVAKLLVHGDDEIRDMIIPEFYGHVRRMIKHPEASWILDDIYRGKATVEQKHRILREWYGPEFALSIVKDLEATTSELSAILAESPERRTPILRALKELISHLVQKKQGAFTLLHDAMLQYFLSLKDDTEEMAEFIESLKQDETGDLLKNLAFTKSGSRMVCLALAHSTAKNRKLLLKAYSGTIPDLAMDVHGHMVLIAAYEVVDDTVLSSKAIFPELLGKKEEERQAAMLNLLSSPAGRISLSYLLAGSGKSALLPNNVPLLEEIKKIRESTSKKAAGQRREELLKIQSPLFFEAIASQPETLMRTPFGCQFITEVCLGGIGEKGSALKAIAKGIKADPEGENDPLLSLPAVGKMLKKLVLGGRYDSELGKIRPIDPPLGFHDILFKEIKADIIDWATKPYSFVIVALLEAEGFSHRKELLKILKGGKDTLLKAAAEGEAKSVVPAGDKRGNVGKTSSAAGKNAENQGLTILLERLE
ncbi:MAG: pumilio domain member 6 [Trizodia sp. TS-e1964]|nr:MAG: pumilio domain member 6 [Trizodia sp. TS-e1964]